MMDIEEYTEQWRNRERELELTGQLNQWGFDVLSAWSAQINECADLRQQLAERDAEIAKLRELLHNEHEHDEHCHVNSDHDRPLDCPACEALTPLAGGQDTPRPSPEHPPFDMHAPFDAASRVERERQERVEAEGLAAAIKTIEAMPSPDKSGCNCGHSRNAHGDYNMRPCLRAGCDCGAYTPTSEDSDDD